MYASPRSSVARSLLLRRRREAVQILVDRPELVIVETCERLPRHLLGIELLGEGIDARADGLDEAVARPALYHVQCGRHGHHAAAAAVQILAVALRATDP